MDTYHCLHSRDYTLGHLLLTLREKIGLTQKELARAVGVSKKAIYNWETGNDYPTGTNLKKLLVFYVISHAFTPGHEHEEAQLLWEQASLHAPRRKALFDDEWFTSLLGKQSLQPTVK